MRRPFRNATSKQPARLGLEQLEQRWVLSSAPLLTVVGDQTTDEGSLLDLTDIGTFSDIVEGTTGGGSSIGLNPDDFTSLGAFDPTANVVIDTDALTIDGVALGTTTNADTGSGSYEIAVFTFDSFELDAGITLTASGARPLAILSQDSLSVFGTIDVSATSDGDPFNGEQLAGAGGGDGGRGSDQPILLDGDPAAGAPSNSVGKPVSQGGGTGGGHGGNGGRAETFGGGTAGVRGLAFGDLQLGIQGGSGGGTAGQGLFIGTGFLAGGGGGGGGIELGANNQIEIGATGSVLANGGDGSIGPNVGANTGGGGGGAGGGILLHSALVTHNGLLSAVGGGGGFAPRSGGGGGGGEILIAYSDTLSDLSGAADVSGGVAPFSGESGFDGVFTTIQETPPSVPIIESYDFSIDWGDGSALETGAATIDTPGVNIGDTVLGSFDGSHTYADDGVYTVTVSVISDTGSGPAETTDTETFLVTVNNVAPVLANVATDSPTIGGAVEGDTVTLTADFTDVGVLDTHTATIDWGDGTTTAGVVDQGLGTVTGDHVYANGGIFEVTITLTDDDTGQAAEATAAVVAGVGENDGVLQAVGTNGNDFVKIFRHHGSGDYKVLFKLAGGAWTWRTFDGTTVDKIEMLLGDGDDIGFVSRSVDINATIDTGDGDDFLGGGSGDDVLLAGPGYDLLFGGRGRDLMIGGAGSDLIFGDGGSDILISGTTAFDNDAAARDAIMAEWTSDRTYQQRSDNLRGIVGDTWDDRENGEVFLIAEGPLATVFDDESIDWLIGGRGRDLYFAGDDDVSFARFSEIVEEIEAEAPV